MIVHLINHGAERGIPPEALLNRAVHVQIMKAAILLIGGYGYLLGFGFLGLGLYLRFPSGIHKVLALVIVAVSLVGLIILVIGDHVHSLTLLYRVAGLTVFPLDSWALILGIALYTGHPSLAPSQPG